MEPHTLTLEPPLKKQRRRPKFATLYKSLNGFQLEGEWLCVVGFDTSIDDQEMRCPGDEPYAWPPGSTLKLSYDSKGVLSGELKWTSYFHSSFAVAFGKVKAIRHSMETIMFPVLGHSGNPADLWDPPLSWTRRKVPYFTLEMDHFRRRPEGISVENNTKVSSDSGGTGGWFSSLTLSSWLPGIFKTGEEKVTKRQQERMSWERNHLPNCGDLTERPPALHHSVELNRVSLKAVKFDVFKTGGKVKSPPTPSDDFLNAQAGDLGLKCEGVGGELFYGVFRRVKKLRPRRSRVGQPARILAPRYVVKVPTRVLEPGHPGCDANRFVVHTLGSTQPKSVDFQAKTRHILVNASHAVVQREVERFRGVVGCRTAMMLVNLRWFNSPSEALVPNLYNSRSLCMDILSFAGLTLEINMPPLA